jgi:hypothetical protein
MSLLFGGNGVVNAARKTHKRRVRTAKRRRAAQPTAPAHSFPAPELAPAHYWIGFLPAASSASEGAAFLILRR